MFKYNVSEIRNIGLIGTVGTGKTSLADAILFNVGLSTRLGKVDQETSLMDFEPEEMKKKTTIGASFATFSYKGLHFNMIDTPGAAHFIADSRSCIQAVDTCVFLVDSIDGVKVQAMDLIKLANSLGKSTFLLINKIDREYADYHKAMETLSVSGLNNPVLMQLPIGQEHDFKGIVDILRMKAYTFDLNESGKYTETEIPTDMVKLAQDMREKAIESIVEADDMVLNKYLDGQSLTDDEIYETLRKGVVECSITPILLGAGNKNLGVCHLLDMLATCSPSPADKPIIRVYDSQNNELTLQPIRDEHLSSLVFKSISDPYAGHLTILRIYSGSLSHDGMIYNARTKHKERFSHILSLVGKKHETVDAAGAGDIIAFAKLKDTLVGDVFCDEKYPIQIPLIEQPKPVISFAIKPKSKGDEDKIQHSLKRMMEEDVTLTTSREEQTKELLISGMGQSHLEVVVEKLKRKFGVEVELSAPKVPYRETIQTSAKAQGKHKKQSGGHGQYGDCWIEIEPLEKGEGFQFVDRIVGGAIPRNYIPAVEAGVKEALQEGFVAGYPIVDIKVTVYDGGYHPVDSSEMAFKIAGSLAVKNSVPKANPIVLEPVYTVNIIVPEENVGDIMGDLNSRRGHMLGVDTVGKAKIVKAHIPLVEMLRYAPDLDSMTSGSGTFDMEFSHYDKVSGNVTIPSNLAIAK